MPNHLVALMCLERCAVSHACWHVGQFGPTWKASPRTKARGAIPSTGRGEGSKELRRVFSCVGHGRRLRSSFRSGPSSLTPVNWIRESARVWPVPSPVTPVPIATPNSFLEAESAEPSPRLASAGGSTPLAVNDTAPVTLDGGR